MTVGAGEELALWNGGSQVIVEPKVMLIEVRRLVDQATKELNQKAYPNLTRLLSDHEIGGSLLVTVFEHFCARKLSTSRNFTELQFTC